MGKEDHQRKPTTGNSAEDVQKWQRNQCKPRQRTVNETSYKDTKKGAQEHKAIRQEHRRNSKQQNDEGTTKTTHHKRNKERNQTPKQPCGGQLREKRDNEKTDSKESGATENDNKCYKQAKTRRRRRQRKGVNSRLLEGPRYPTKHLTNGGGAKATTCQ
ncbi:Hypothetical predicted protein [Mytilus galloprovincialis]|uniref:Uncharacterized protein n=1 Tax=Mytilus galloprovincialis TaxID=29158 RepID=A0A8B6H7A2_MYTGA|nr:Hypothetical predicted protein [Mytilus galloprovincialis]